MDTTDNALAQFVARSLASKLTEAGAVRPIASQKRKKIGALATFGGAETKKRASMAAATTSTTTSVPVGVTSETLVSRAAAEAMAESQLEGVEQRPLAPQAVRPRRTIAKAQRRSTAAGPGWFGMAPTELTPEQERDLKVLQRRATVDVTVTNLEESRSTSLLLVYYEQMRQYIDPKKHFRAQDSKKFSKYAQLGTVISAPQEHYTSRVPRKLRAKTFAQEFVTGDPRLQSHTKRKFHELQDVSRRGRKGKGHRLGKHSRRGKSSGWA